MSRVNILIPHPTSGMKDRGEVEGTGDPHSRDFKQNDVDRPLKINEVNRVKEPK